MQFYVVYGRKNARHQWSVQGHGNNLERVIVLAEVYHQNSLQIGHKNVQYSIRSMDQEQFDGKPWVTRVLPGMAAKH